MIERAVYSLWTAPMEDENVGFNTEEAMVNCFRLSLFHSKKWFKEVHFVTDLKGKEIIEKHGLEFDNVITDLEEVLNGVNKKYWSLGKIYACKIQEKPFIHMDMDAIWFKQPPEDLLKADAFFQNGENEQWPFYKDMIKQDKKYYWDKPIWYDTRIVKAVNCGFIGFNRLDFLNEWWEESLKYVDHLEARGGHSGEVNISCLIFEQHWVGCLCEHYGYSVVKLSDFYINPKGKRESVSENLAKYVGYTHLLSRAKRNQGIEDAVKRKLIELEIPF